MNGWTSNNSSIRERILQHLNADIICISESHVLNKDNSFKPSLTGYKWIDHARRTRHVNAKRAYGGVGVLIKDYLFVDFLISVIDKAYDGILGIKFTHKITDLQFLVFAVYLPPEESSWGRDSNSFYNHLLSQIYAHANISKVFICGDLNSRVGNLSDSVDGVDLLGPREVLDSAKNGHGDSFVDFLHETKMCVINGRVTPQFDDYTSISSKGRAVVDYVCVPHEMLNICSEFKVIPCTDLLDVLQLYPLISDRCKSPDHSLLSLTVKFHAGIYEESTQTQDDIHESENTSNNDIFTNTRRYSFSNIPHEMLAEGKLSSLLQEVIDRIERKDINQIAVDDLYSDFCDKLFSEMDQYLQFKDVSKKSRKKFKCHKPFWNPELTSLWREMRDAERLFVRCTAGRGVRCDLRSAFQRKQVAFDKCLRQTERTYNKEQANYIETIHTENPKTFWEQIKNLGPHSKPEIPLKVYDESGNKIGDTNYVLHKWKSDFSSLLNNEDSDQFDNEFYESKKSDNDNFQRNHIDDAKFNSVLNEEIELSELEKAINKIKYGKAMGPDFVPNEILKTGKLNMLLLEFMKLCFNFDIIPSIWEKAIISPIPKSSTKDPFVPLNYRGISLLSCVFKLYTSILNTRLMKYCEDNNLIVEEQNGFRQGRSCTDHLYSFSSIIRNRLNQGLDTYTCFVDFQKAFDWVDRDLLLYKLSHFYNIGGTFYKTIRTLYTRTFSCVKVSDKFTDWFKITSGVRQGDALSPTLFSLFLNDLATGIKGLQCGVNLGDDFLCSILLYADDIVLFADSEENLQKQLDYLNNWCKKWRLMVNSSKTEVVHFRPKRRPRTSFSFHIGDSCLNIASHYRYLGLVFNEFLEFDYTGNVLADSASRALGSIRNKLQYLKECRYDTFTKLFTSCISPILDYSCAVWGYKNNKKIEKIQHRAIRYFLGVHRFASIHAIDGDMGWASANLRRKVDMCRYWNRLQSMPSGRLPRRVFDWEVNFNNNWATEVQSVLQSIDMANVFANRHICDLTTVRSCLEKNEIDIWNSSRFNKPKLRYYNLYKCTVEPEDYVTNKNLSKYSRSLLAQFRCGILPIEVELGRFRNVKLEDRICPMCLNDVEDEFHLLCVCNVYDDLRKVLYNKTYDLNPDFDALDEVEKFMFINDNMQTALSKFLYSAMKRRKEKLYNSQEL